MVTFMNREEYRKRVYLLCDTVKAFYPESPSQISRKQISDLWRDIQPRAITVPGFWMSNDMEDWGKDNGYSLLYTVTNSGRRRNVTLVKSQA